MDNQESYESSENVASYSSGESTKDIQVTNRKANAPKNLFKFKKDENG